MVQHQSIKQTSQSKSNPIAFAMASQAAEAFAGVLLFHTFIPHSLRSVLSTAMRGACSDIRRQPPPAAARPAPAAVCRCFLSGAAFLRPFHSRSMRVFRCSPAIHPGTAPNAAQTPVRILQWVCAGHTHTHGGFARGVFLFRRHHTTTTPARACARRFPALFGCFFHRLFVRMVFNTHWYP